MPCTPGNCSTARSRASPTGPAKSGDNGAMTSVSPHSVAAPEPRAQSTLNPVTLVTPSAQPSDKFDAIGAPGGLGKGMIAP